MFTIFETVENRSNGKFGTITHIFEIGEMDFETVYMVKYENGNGGMFKESELIPIDPHVLKSNNMKYKKPALGLRPKYIADEERQKEISNAINRYLQAKQEIPLAWINEYNEIIKRINHFHYVVLEDDGVTPHCCTGENSTLDSVKRLFPMSEYKLIQGICPVCKKEC